MEKRLFLIPLLFVGMLLLQDSFAQDTRQWHLPEGVKARIGKGRANDIAVSPDGTQLAIATGLGIWLYNMNTGAEIALLTGHTAWVRTVAYSPNGKTLTSVSDREILLWNPETQKQKTTFDSQGSQSIAYSPNGQLLAVGRWGGIDILNAGTGDLQRALSGHTSDVAHLSFLPDNKTLVSAARDGRDTGIRVWNTRTGKLIRTLSGHNDLIQSMALSPDGNTLVSASWDGTIHFYNTKKGGKTTLDMWAESLAYSPDGNQIAVGTHEIRLLNARTRQTQRTFSGHTNGVHRMVFSSDGNTLVSASSDGTIRLWDFATGSNRLTIEGHFVFERVALSPNGKTIATASEKDIYLWNTSNGKFSQAFQVQGDRIFAIAYSPNGNTLGVGSWNDGLQVLLLNAQTGNVNKALRYQGEPVGSIAFSPNGKLVAGGSWDGKIRLWNARTGKLLRTLTGHQQGIESMVFSPDSKMLATGIWGGEGRLWNPNTGKLLRTISTELSSRGSVAFSPDGKVLATGGWNNIQLQNTQTGQLQQIIDGRGQALAYSKDGQTLASGDWQRIHLWNARTGKLRRSLLGPSEGMHYLAFVPNGKTLVSHGEDHTILIYNMNALPKIAAEDVNLDGVVDVKDLIDVASSFGKSVQKGVYPNPDVDADGVVNRKDVLRVIAILEAAPGAPVSGSRVSEGLTAESLRYWIDRAKSLNNRDTVSQKGLQELEKLLAVLTTHSRNTPVETVLLPNYPNPFNPETWIPYHLATSAHIVINIYDAKGVLVRVLPLGQQPAGYYTRQSRAAYWDGKNTLGETVASGVYFYQLETDTGSLLRKMVIVK